MDLLCDSVSVFPATSGICFQQTGSYETTAHFLFSTKQQSDKISNKMVKKVEHLAAKQTGYQELVKTEPELKESEFWTYIQQTNTNTTQMLR